MSDTIEVKRKLYDRLEEQARAWVSVYQICIELGAPPRGSALDCVRSFINDLYSVKEDHGALMQLLERISSREINLREEMKP